MLQNGKGRERPTEGEGSGAAGTGRFPHAAEIINMDVIPTDESARSGGIPSPRRNLRELRAAADPSASPRIVYPRVTPQTAGVDRIGWIGCERSKRGSKSELYFVLRVPIGCRGCPQADPLSYADRREHKIRCRRAGPAYNKWGNKKPLSPFFFQPRLPSSCAILPICVGHGCFCSDSSIRSWWNFLRTSPSWPSRGFR